MAIFLNTDKLNNWIPKLISETVKELIIIVPYIKTSERMYGYLDDANKRGVETTLVYRENKLSTLEREKFHKLDNLNLLHHPNVHCKCYFNEKYLILCSMNLYEYSEKNNREMGILLHRAEVNNGNFATCDDEKLFEEAIKEIREIINGSDLEKVSRETDVEGFEIEIIKNEKEKQEEYCKKINKSFIHKKFEVIEYPNGIFATCRNYFDKINVRITHRVELDMCMQPDKIDRAYAKFNRSHNEFMFEDFKVYWNSTSSPIYLYKDRAKLKWDNIENENENFVLIKSGIDKLILFLRECLAD